MDLKKTFFDTKAVTDSVPPAIRKALSKVGAFTRQRVRSSLKYSDTSSLPGRPPNVHKSKNFTRKRKVKGATVQQASSPLRELIQFGYDAAERDVVIGPALGGSRSGAPETLEKGGTAVINAYGQRRMVHLSPRPYMLPGFVPERDKAAAEFKDLIR